MRLISLFFLLVLSLNAREINLNFQNLELNDFIKMVAKINHKNILLDQTLRGKVNFISVKPIDEKNVYNILLNILKSKGYTIVSENGFLKVVRSTNVLSDAPPLKGKTKIDEIQTDIITIKNSFVRDILGQISYLKSRYGRIIVNQANNMLIVTDYPKNIKIIREVIKKIDTKRRKIIKYIDLKYTQSRKIYPKVSEIARDMFNTKVYKYKLIVNDNANSIIVIGDKPIVEKLCKIIENLDTKPKPADIKTEIITLKNSDVSTISKVIKSVIITKYKKERPSITADKETNSLIVLATPEQIEAIKTVIKALDIPKQQVYVKARILEISNSKAAQVGSNLGLLAGSGTNSGLYTMSANLGGPAIAFDVGSLGLSIPTLKEGLALGATLDLLETYGAARKLSEPSILCINNTPSTIYVGKTISVLTGKTTSTSTSQSYTRQDIGLTLKIKPRIDSDNKVSLSINTIIEDILPGSQVGLPITSKRDIRTTAIVKNGQSIIIGGLVKNNNDTTIKKVPLLGDIPLLGAAFRHKQTNRDQTTLAIILTPFIVKKSEDLDKLRSTIAKLNVLENEFVEKIKKRKKNVKH